LKVFYLVRHAHSKWMPDEARPLSPRGLIDAEAVATVLVDFPIESLYTSPARRAYQTITPLAQQLALPVHVIPDLRERVLSSGAVDDFFDAVRTTWLRPAFAFPGGESNAVAQQRGVVVLQHLMAQDPARHLLLATHGNLLALIVQHFIPSLGFDFWQSLTMPDVYRLCLDDDGSASLVRLWTG